MARYLKQLSTGRIYNYSPFIEKHEGMVPCDSEGEVLKTALEELENVVEPEEPETEAPVEETQEAEAVETPAEPEVPVEAVETPAEEETPPADFQETDERMAKIKEVVAGIPVEEYGAPYGGKPALPRVAQVSELCGFKVYVTEIMQAMGV